MFDNDGLLLHTEPCWTLAQQEFFRSYGRTFDLADKQALVGTSPRTSAPILQRLLSGADSGERLSDQMYSPALTEIAAGASPRPGAVELVARLQSAGLPLAVASNAPRRHLLAGLQRVGLLDAFDVVLGVDDVAGSQPGARPLPAAAGGSGQAVAPCPTAVVSSQGQHRARAPRGVAVQHLRRVPLGLRRSPLASSCFATRCSIGTVPAAGGR